MFWVILIVLCYWLGKMRKMFLGDRTEMQLLIERAEADKDNVFQEDMRIWREEMVYECKEQMAVWSRMENFLSFFRMTLMFTLIYVLVLRFL